MPVTLDLLPATSVDRVEAAVRIPERGRLTLAWDTGPNRDIPFVMDVWLQPEDGVALHLASDAFRAGSGLRTMTVDLAAHAGTRCLLRATAGTAKIAWRRAELAGVASGRAEDLRLRAERGAPDVIVYLIDTLRPDVLGAYGGPGPTPSFDRLAGEGRMYERAYSTDTWTRPAVASLFTGLAVASHRVTTERDALPEEALTLAERFKLRGYVTVGVVANGHVTQTFDFDQGFDRFDYLHDQTSQQGLFDPQQRVENPPAAAVDAAALRELDRLGAKRPPLFLYVHVVDPHNPYAPPEWLLPEPRPAIHANNYLMRMLAQGEAATPQSLAALALAYRGAVAYADRELGRFVGGLRERLDLDDSLLVVLADHGEGFFEHRVVGHEQWPYEELVRIPLLVRGPGIRPGSRATSPVSIAGVYAWLGEKALGITPPPGAPTLQRPRGVRWFPGAAPATPDFVVAEHGGRVLVRDRWKLTIQPDYPATLRTRLFDLRSDPLEQHDLLRREHEVARSLEAADAIWQREVRGMVLPQHRLDVALIAPELARKLSALGYVH